jgi:hypothetical protein
VDIVMDKIFQRILDSNFSELAGLTLDASIPVPESLLNEIIESELRGNKNITSCHITIHRENRVTANLRMSMWLWPLNLKLKLFGSVDLTHPIKVRAFLENNLLLGKLGAFLKMLPAGITLYNDQVVVDLEHFIPAEYNKFLSLVKSIDIRTEEKKLFLDVKINR